MIDKVKAMLMGLQGIMFGIWGFLTWNFFNLMGKEIKQVSKKYRDKGWVYFEEELMSMMSAHMGWEILAINMMLLGQLIAVMFLGYWTLIGLIPIAYVGYMVWHSKWNYAMIFLLKYTICADDNFDEKFLLGTISTTPFSRNSILNYEHLLVPGSW